MSLATAIQNAVGSAFIAIDDLKISGSATYRTLKVNDVKTQKITYNNLSDTINIVQYDFTSNEKLDEGVNDNDYKFLIQISELTQDIEDYKSIKVGSKVWDIHSIILRESSNSVVTYHMRLADANAD